MKQLAEQTQQGFEQLLKALEPYPKAKAYIQNLIQPGYTLRFLVASKGRSSSADLQRN